MKKTYGIHLLLGVPEYVQMLHILTDASALMTKAGIEFFIHQVGDILTADMIICREVHKDDVMKMNPGALVGVIAPRGGPAISGASEADNWFVIDPEEPARAISQQFMAIAEKQAAEVEALIALN